MSTNNISFYTYLSTIIKNHPQISSNMHLSLLLYTLILSLAVWDHFTCHSMKSFLHVILFLLREIWVPRKWVTVVVNFMFMYILIKIMYILIKIYPLFSFKEACLKDFLRKANKVKFPRNRMFPWKSEIVTKLNVSPFY